VWATAPKAITVLEWLIGILIVVWIARGLLKLLQGK
jgi:hypothetical protein